MLTAEKELLIKDFLEFYKVPNAIKKLETWNEVIGFFDYEQIKEAFLDFHKTKGENEKVIPASIYKRIKSKKLEVYDFEEWRKKQEVLEDAGIFTKMMLEQIHKIGLDMWGFIGTDRLSSEQKEMMIDAVDKKFFQKYGRSATPPYEEELTIKELEEKYEQN